jgi:3-isopropylmalate dehydratase small subunit
LPILESPEAAQAIEEGNEVEVDVAKGEIKDLTTGKTYTSAPFPEAIQQIIAAGGLINYVAERVRKDG